MPNTEKGNSYVAVAANKSRFLGLAAREIAAGKMTSDARSTATFVLSQTFFDDKKYNGTPITRMAKSEAVIRASLRILFVLVRNVYLSWLLSILLSWASSENRFCGRNEVSGGQYCFFRLEKFATYPNPLNPKVVNEAVDDALNW
jgi:hypothetical protein